MSDQDKQRLHAFIRGRVQGVGFRHFVMTSAGDLGLTGWVRNRRDGSVEVVAEGEISDLDQLTAALGRGPVSASVRDVEESRGDYQDQFTGFKVKPTH